MFLQHSIILYIEVIYSFLLTYEIKTRNITTPIRGCDYELCSKISLYKSL